MAEAVANTAKLAEANPHLQNLHTLNPLPSLDTQGQLRVNQALLEQNPQPLKLDLAVKGKQVHLLVQGSLGFRWGRF